MKPWEMGQSEYETWYEDNMGEKDNIPYSERMSQWKKQGQSSRQVLKFLKSRVRSLSR
jgi:hypothetical protein